MKSQTEQIRAHLESGKTITALEALREFGCLLIHEQSLPVNSRMVKLNGKRVAEYSL